MEAMVLSLSDWPGIAVEREWRQRSRRVYDWLLTADGRYDKDTKTGGSNGATMRFAPEGDHGANAGLKAARDFLEPVKQKFPWITYSDLWTLAGVASIQEMQGTLTSCFSA